MAQPEYRGLRNQPFFPRSPLCRSSRSRHRGQRSARPVPPPALPASGPARRGTPWHTGFGTRAAGHSAERGPLGSSGRESGVAAARAQSAHTGGRCGAAAERGPTQTAPVLGSTRRCNLPAAASPRPRLAQTALPRPSESAHRLREKGYSLGVRARRATLVGPRAAAGQKARGVPAAGAHGSRGSPDTAAAAASRAGSGPRTAPGTSSSPRPARRGAHPPLPQEAGPNLSERTKRPRPQRGGREAGLPASSASPGSAPLRSGAPTPARERPRRGRPARLGPSTGLRGKTEAASSSRASPRGPARIHFPSGRTAARAGAGSSNAKTRLRSPQQTRRRPRRRRSARPASDPHLPRPEAARWAPAGPASREASEEAGGRRARRRAGGRRGG